MKLFAHVNGDSFEFEVSGERDKVIINGAEETHVLVPDDQKTSVRTVFIDNRRIEFGWQRKEDIYLILIDGVEYEVEVRDDRAERAAKVRFAGEAGGGEASIRAPIPGRVVKVLVKEGDAVTKDQPLLTLDAMKLENEIPAPRDGKVKTVHVQPGVAVERGQPLITIA